MESCSLWQATLQVGNIPALFKKRSHVSQIGLKLIIQVWPELILPLHLAILPNLFVCLFCLLFFLLLLLLLLFPLLCPFSLVPGT